MTPAHSTLRELVAHLARAQRAFDAGRLDEAERAIADALALDPHNVQAADLRQRIRKDRRPAAPDRAGAVAPVDAVGSRGSVARGPSPAGRVSPAAWSTFEGRVRGRRADRAVVEAQEALGRGDAEAARAALAELDAVSPGDPRREVIAASLARQRWTTSPYRTPPPAASAAPAVPARRPAASPARPAASAGARTASPSGTPVKSLAGPALPTGTAPAPPTAAGPGHSELVLADLPIYMQPPAIDPDVAWAAAPRVLPASALRTPRRSGARTAVAFAAVAGTALLGFWILSVPGLDGFLAGALGEQSQPAEMARTPEPTPAPRGRFARGAAVVRATAGVRRRAGHHPVEPAVRSGDSVRRHRALARAGGSAADFGIRYDAQASGARERRPGVGRSYGCKATRPRTSHPAPAPPLAPPVESPMLVPDTRRLPGLSGGAPLGREVTPVPAPPAPAPAAAPPAMAAAAGADRGRQRRARRARRLRRRVQHPQRRCHATRVAGCRPAGLRRAFDQLTAQTITFNRCDVNASGETAEAVCVGRATWVPKVGDRSPKSEPRTWRFALGRDDG